MTAHNFNRWILIFKKKYVQFKYSLYTKYVHIAKKIYFIYFVINEQNFSYKLYKLNGFFI